MQMNANWTQQQNQAIGHRTGEAVVSASAGSGKTSVLIERAVRLIRSGVTDVDRMLIVTFTEDAADELTQRLRTALEAGYRQSARADQRGHLFRQLRLLDRAQISTIHAFSLQILRDHYHLLGLDADIRVFNAEEASLLKHRVLDELFEESYALSDKFGVAFGELVDHYGGRSVDRDLAESVLATHALLASLVDPKEWLARSRRLYTSLADDDFDPARHPVWQYLAGQWHDLCCRADNQLAASVIAARHAGIESVARHLAELQDLVGQWSTLVADGRYEKLLECMPARLPRWPMVRKETPQRAKSEEIKSGIDPLKNELKRLIKDIGTAISGDAIDRMRRQGGLVGAFLDLVDRFSIRLAETKRQHARLEFDDLQRFALDVLNMPQTGRDAGPLVAETYRRKFTFVMVDEYQDVNALQDAIVRAVCRRDDAGVCENLLVVGDVKQSIYRFRLAEPEVFQQLCRRAESEPHAVRRIDLRENFRSRCQVVDTVNGLFENLLVGGPLELEYNEPAKLVFAADYDERSTNEDHETELMVLERRIDIGPDGGDTNTAGLVDLDALKREAYLIAQRIKHLIDSKMPIRDGRDCRAVRQEDVVILLRTLKYTANTFVTMLRRFGLNGYCEQVEAFLEYPEIAEIVAMLKLIDNPYQDIPLAAVLRSELGGMTADDLARVRLASSGPLYRALRTFDRDGGADDPVRVKVARFSRILDPLRRLAGQLTVGELVQQIYHRTDRRAAASVLNKHAEDNLEQFLELARQFSQTGENSLTDFLAYLDLVRDTGQKISSVRAGSGNGVRIMSIHAAKGLEFPVVVLANLGRKINLQGLRRNILIDRHLGIGFRSLDDLSPPSGWIPTAAVQAIAGAGCNKAIAEELRLLYVAMTRAKEKLILSADARLDDLARVAEMTGMGQDSGSDISASRIGSCRTPIAWLTIALAQGDVDNQLSTMLASQLRVEARIAGLAVTVVPAGEQSGWKLPQAGGRGELSQSARGIVDAVLRARPVPQARGDKLGEDVLARLDLRYPYEPLCRKQAKMSVTDLTHRAAVACDEDDLAAVPAVYLTGEAGSFEPLTIADNPGLIRGRAWHRFMQVLDPGGPLDRKGLARQLATMVQRGLLDPGAAEWIDLAKVCEFFRSPPGHVMLDNRGALYRELPFTYLLPVSQLPKHLSPGPFEETVLVQGIVDCLIDTPVGLVIIDYKTDEISAGQVDQKRNHYRCQIELYADALGKIVGTRVESAWLYFTAPGSAVQVS